MAKKKSFEYSFDLQQPVYRQSLEHLLQNATRLHQQGNLAMAEKLYQQVLKVQPKHAYTLNLLGALHSQKGDHPSGEKLIRESLAIDSTVPDYHSNLGLVLQHQGRMAEARDAFLQATKLNPAFIPGWIGMGNSCLNSGDTDTAINAFRKVVEVQPDCFPAYNNLGNIYRDEMMYAEAHEMFNKVVELKPDFAEGWFNLGLLYKQEENGEQAITAFDKAISLKPGYLEALNNRAWCRQYLLDDIEGALQDFENLSKINPDYEIPYYNCKSALYMKQGNLDHAGEMLQKALELNQTPENLQKEYLTNSSVSLYPHTTLERKINWLEYTMRTLGHIAHLREDYDRAFSYYNEANAIQDNLAKYDRDAHEKVVDALIAFFTPDFFARFSDLGTDIELPIIITGMPRSGKTLTEQIIAIYPAVTAAGEIPYFSRLKLKSSQLFESDQDWPFCCQSLNKKIADRLIAEYSTILCNRGNTAHLVTDTSPGNYMYLGLISLLFPKAYIIHCRRNTLDMCMEIYCKGFKNYRTYSYSHNLPDIAHYYLQSLRLIEHWRKVLPLPIMEIQYEDLVADTEGQGRRLFDFCGLEYVTGDLSEYLVAGDNTWDRSRRGLQPVNNSFINFSKHYEKYLEPLREIFINAGMEI